MSGLVPHSKESAFEMQVSAKTIQPFVFWRYFLLLVAVHAALHNSFGNGESNRSLFLPRRRRSRVSSSQNDSLGQGAVFKILLVVKIVSNLLLRDVQVNVFVTLPSLPVSNYCKTIDQVDIRVLSVETHLAGRIYPGDRQELIAYMEKVMMVATMVLIRLTLMTIT